jgi:hypothetical protein
LFFDGRQNDGLAGAKDLLLCGGMSTGDVAIEIGFDPKGFLRMKTKGTINERLLPTLFSMAATAHEKHACDRMLVDHRESGLRLNAAEIYWVPKKLEGHGIKRHRAALLFNRIGEDEKFLETVCANQGVQMKIFTDPDQALAWLMGGIDS